MTKRKEPDPLRRSEAEKIFYLQMPGIYSRNFRELIYNEPSYVWVAWLCYKDQHMQSCVSCVIERCMKELQYLKDHDRAAAIISSWRYIKNVVGFENLGVKENDNKQRKE